MKQHTAYENYPWWIIVLSNILPLSIYFLGSLIINQVGLFWMFLYIAFVLFIEIRLLATGCPECYYYGKWCAFGRGKLSSLFFRKGDPDRFACRTVTWKELAPDFLVILIPVLTGIVLIIIQFNFFLLVAVIGLLLLGFPGNALVRGQIACKYCKQGEIGCPALEAFSKKEG
jgi:hypothetical protein